MGSGRVHARPRENGQANTCVALPEVKHLHVGALIALYERTVSLYAQLVGINAYNQPGWKPAKKAAKSVLDLQSKLLAALQTEPERWWSAEALAQELQADIEAVFP